MPAYAYPTVDELTTFRANNQTYNVWEAIAQITADTSQPYYGPVVNNLNLVDSSGFVWQLTIDSNGIATTTKLETTPEAPASVNFWTPNGIFSLSVDTDGALLTTLQA
jgi:hypothetical protein